LSYEARLGKFAIVDDVDAELDLLLHDFLHRARQPRGALCLVDRLALLFGRQHVQKIGWAGQRAGVGGEDPLGAVLHDVSCCRVRRAAADSRMT
jgi:hypothetical protein